MRTKTLVALALLGAVVSGCTLTEVRGKTKLGQEFRHSGTSNTNQIRYSAQQGLDLKWHNGVSTGISYRRRDDDNGDGNNDNGIFLDFSYPLWKRRSKEDELAMRVQVLERRLAALEATRSTETAPTAMTADNSAATSATD